MTAILHPFRALRDNILEIGTAVKASREYSRASSMRSSREQAATAATSAIPL